MSERADHDDQTYEIERHFDPSARRTYVALTGESTALFIKRVLAQAK
jgi:hypothetical protein